MKEIQRENGKIKAKITKDEYGTELLTTRNGIHWTGHSISPVLASLIIEVLQEYLSNPNLNKEDR